MASLAVLLAGETPILGAYTQVFMKATGNFIILYFPLFLLGAIFGKLMDDSGSAQAISQWAVKTFGEERSILVVVLSCAVADLWRGVPVCGGLCSGPHRRGAVPGQRPPQALIPGAVALGAFLFYHDRPAGHPGHPKRHSHAVFRDHALCRAHPRDHRRGHHACPRHAVAEPEGGAAAARGEGYGHHEDAAPRVDKKLRAHAEGEGFRYRGTL
jgi:hypothetical protein